MQTCKSGALELHDTHRHAGTSSLPVSPEPAVRIPHIQPNCDYLFLFHDGGQSSSIGCGQPQMNLCDMSGRETINPQSSHGHRWTKTHWQEAKTRYF